VGSAALLALSACSQAPAPPAARLDTVFDVEALYAGGATPDDALAPDEGLPGGFPIGNVTTGPAVAPAGPALTIRPGFAEGYPITYVTTEVWSNYAQVWMQPAYVPITGFDASGAPMKLADAAGWHPIFSVGPGSGFYSPFWQIVYFQVPVGTDPAAFTSARQVLDSGYQLTPSQGQTMPLVPDGTTANGQMAKYGWIDGAKISFLNFGTATFGWDAATNVVSEVPIYAFTLTGSDGAAHVLQSIPEVLGTSPPGSAVAPPLKINGQPRYSAYWRITTVVVPSTARVFAPPGTQVNQDLAAIGVMAGTSAAETSIGAAAYYASYVGRIAVNPGDPAAGIAGCFDDVNLLEHDATNASTCTWLDSQEAIEANVDLSTSEATGISVTCPVITFKTSTVTPL
jgi:hypothetical protein